MKVYILWYSCHQYGKDVDDIYGIYSSLSRAKEELRFYETNYRQMSEFMHIEERELDKSIFGNAILR